MGGCASTASAANPSHVSVQCSTCCKLTGLTATRVLSSSLSVNLCLCHHAEKRTNAHSCTKRQVLLKLFSGGVEKCVTRLGQNTSILPLLSLLRIQQNETRICQMAQDHGAIRRAVLRGLWCHLFLNVASRPSFAIILPARLNRASGRHSCIVAISDHVQLHL
jgi:hypothetical protein